MSEIINREATTVPVSDIEPHPDNPRDGDINAIWDSIEQNGFYGAVVVQESSGRILAGNHRYLAAKEAGLEEVPVIYVDVGDEKALRIMLADNRTNDLAGYDEDALDGLLDHLSSTADGLAGTGYGADTDAVDDLMDRIDGPSRDLDQAGSEGTIRPVIAVGDVRLVEKALSATGEMNRGEALLEVCRSYVGSDEETIDELI